MKITNAQKKTVKKITGHKAKEVIVKNGAPVPNYCNKNFEEDPFYCSSYKIGENLYIELSHRMTGPSCYEIKPDGSKKEISHLDFFNNKN